tara:strand:- start:21 stop:677 length:657 start_codon:yes stop_codon:yes gene_type:complete
MTTQSKLKDDVAAPVNGYQRRRLETRRQLLQAGRALFVEKAVEQVSIESITERAGVAKGSFYNHFESREALFDEVIGLAIEELLAKYAAFDPPTEDPLVRARERGRFVFCTLLSDPATCRLLLQGGQPLQGGAIDRVMRMVLGDTLAIGLSMGSLSHLDPEIVYAAYFGVVTQTIAHLLTCEDDIDVAAAADEVTALCFAVLGLAPYMPPAGNGEQVA